MIDSFSVRSRNRQPRILSIPIFAISLFITSIFIASCGDEGDTTGTTDVLQPATTPPATQPSVPAEPPAGVDVPPAVEEPVVEEPKVSFKDDIQPILAERCSIPGMPCRARCWEGLTLLQYDTFKKGGNGGVAFDAGNGKGSLVVKRIDGGGMPPIPPPLDADQVQLFIDWIDEGAENN